MYKLEKKYSPHQFSIFRILFGVYLFTYFVSLIPYGSELFSSEGMVDHVSLNWTNALLPEVFTYATNPIFVTSLLSILAILSLCVSFGYWRRISAALLWVGWAALYNMNNLTGDPSLAFVGLLLLALAIIPVYEPLALSNLTTASKEHKKWFVPAILFWGMWFIFGASFTISGLEKFASPAWFGGSAIILLYEGPMVFHYVLTDFLRTLPEQIHKLTTWLVLYSQMLALPAIFFRITRLIFWLITTAFFVFGHLVLDLTYVLIALVLFYFFMFDSTWFKGRQKTNMLFIDGTCTACTAFAKFIKTEDIHDRYSVETFQSKAIKGFLSDEEIEKMETMVLIVDEVIIYRGADALIYSIANLGGIWITIKILFIFPKKIRSKWYQYISVNRCRIGRCL
ncbi:MAG: putative DCC family thiol-disulfide oxidoreductase YuxK [Acidimicrobiales bacterium]|jgi:predicted DCC family thiol-disulfide oxidoreductase YuxK